MDVIELGAERLPGISNAQAAQEWLEECNDLDRGIRTPKKERLLRSFQRVGTGNLPRGGAGSFASYDALIQAQTLGQAYGWDAYKIASGAAQAAGVWQSLWPATGSPGAGAVGAGTPGAVCDSAAGGMTFPAPGGGQSKFLTTVGMTANQNAVLQIADRLVQVGGLTLSANAAKTVSSAALDRYSTSTTALNNEAWCEVYSANTSVAAPTLSLSSYTTGDGTAAQVGSTVVLPNVATVVTTAIQLPFVAGKPGIQACSTLTVATQSTAAAIGNFVIRRPLAYLPVISGQWNERDLVLQLMALPQVFDNATLDMFILASGAVTTTVWGNTRLVYG